MTIDTECTILQQEELEVLESIYPDCISNDVMKGILRLEVPVEFDQPRNVTVVNDGTLSDESALSSSSNVISLASLSALPPLLIDLILPPTYPLHNPPQIISLHATYSWLPSELNLQRILQDKWQEGQGVLYNIVEFVRSGEFLNALGLTMRSNDIRIFHPAPHRLSPLLTTYDASAKLAQFSQNSFSCEICLSSIKGARCVLLSCSHVFCRECLVDFWGSCITEGDVGRVTCPDVQCVKDGREANEEEVRRVVTEEEVRRWKWLREKRTIERDPTIIYCPRAFCQTPVQKPPDVEDGSGWERLRTCPECGNSFCAFCKRTWHGPLSDCPLSATETFILEYISLPDDSPGRLVIERRFGRTIVQKLVAKYEEEQANKQWIERSTMACPSCHVHVEKSLGCNHMTCVKCKQHFCYRCGDKLQANDPYIHFSTPGRPCFSKLFDFQTIEDEWQPVEGFDVL